MNCCFSNHISFFFPYYFYWQIFLHIILLSLKLVQKIKWIVVLIQNYSRDSYPELPWTCELASELNSCWWFLYNSWPWNEVVMRCFMSFICLADVKAVLHLENKQGSSEGTFPQSCATLEKNLFYYLLHKRSFILPVLIYGVWEEWKSFIFPYCYRSWKSGSSILIVIEGNQRYRWKDINKEYFLFYE